MRSYRLERERELQALLMRKNEAAAITIENNAKRAAPIDTGRLRSSITHDSDASGAIVGTNVTYGIFVEAGTRFQNPQPFLVPGLQDSIADLRRIYGE